MGQFSTLYTNDSTNTTASLITTFKTLTCVSSDFMDLIQIPTNSSRRRLDCDYDCLFSSLFNQQVLLN